MRWDGMGMWFWRCEGESARHNYPYPPAEKYINPMQVYTERRCFSLQGNSAVTL